MNQQQGKVHKPTDEQAAVISAAAGKQSMMIRAYAGCAKTSTLVMAAQKIRVPALALAFNRTIALELGDKFPGNFQTKTLNGLGHSAWVRQLPDGTKVQLDDRKQGKLVTQAAKAAGLELVGDQWDAARRLMGEAMQAGLSPGDQGAPLVPDTPATWASLAAGLMIGEDEIEGLVQVARQALIQSIELARAGVISFDDQIYCPTILGGKWPQFPVLFVDEAQDLSPLNHRMLGLALRPDGRLVAVGDPKQAIYAFRGADSRSMDNLEGLRPEWVALPLATTFRCPKIVVERAQKHAPGFRAWYANREGSFHRLQRQGVALKGWTFADLRALRPDGQLAILCRNNGPLLAMALKLLRAGIGVRMLGRDIGKVLIGLTKKIMPSDDLPVDKCTGLLMEWEERESALALANKHPEKLAGISDRADCLRAVMENAAVGDARQLREMLDRLFSRTDGLVTLGSIHRSKGLEFDLVLHLDPWRVPSRYARQLADAGDLTALEQEWNLRYVCETRTKDVLVEAALADYEGA